MFHDCSSFLWKTELINEDENAIGYYAIQRYMTIIPELQFNNFYINVPLVLFSLL